jgi:iron complex transport system ATP-binding protein
MAGGGSGEVLMRALADAHVPFTVGALNIGDSDHTLALRLADEVITEQPYAPISTEALAQVRASLSHAPLLILCPAPIGPGNLVLLQEAAQFARRGLLVLLLAASSAAKDALGDEDVYERDYRREFAARDYTNGEGVRFLEILLQSDAVVVQSIGEALEMVKKHLPLPPEAQISPE